MRETVTFNVSVGLEFSGDWQTLAKEIVTPLQPVEVREGKFLYRFTFDHYPPEIEEIAARLQAEGISTSIWVNRKYTKKELLAAEYLILGYEGQVNARGRTLTWHTELLCPHCGFEEVVWHYETLQIREQPKGYRLAVVDHNPTVMSHALFERLWSMGVTGLVAAPVGGVEPADWYGIRSDHFLPPVQVPPTARWSPDPYRTSQCATNHGMGRIYSERYYNRRGFNALDFNHAYERLGDKWRGVRTTIISQRVYRLLVEVGIRKLQCVPIRFID